MIFIIPIILGAAAFAAAATGAVKGAQGISDIQKAQKTAKEAQERHERTVNKLKENWQETQRLAEEYGQLQLDIKQRTIERFVEFIKRIGQRASQGDMQFLEGLEGVSPQQLEEYEAAVLEAKTFATGGVKALGAAYTAGQGTVGLVALFGTASTGTAIGGLSGAAAWNATLAWLGGGSLAAGGGGMALGTLVLGGITIGPALAIGGFVLAGQGEKSLTQAQEYAAQANVEIGKVYATGDFLKQVRQRITELKGLVENLNRRALLNLNELESQPFDRDQDAAKFQQTALLIKALAEIMKTPVLDAEGDLNPALVNIQLKYRTL